MRRHGGRILAGLVVVVAVAAIFHKDLGRLLGGRVEPAKQPAAAPATRPEPASAGLTATAAMPAVSVPMPAAGAAAPAEPAPAAETAKPAPPKLDPEQVIAQATKLAEGGKAAEAVQRLSELVIHDRVSGDLRERAIAQLDKLNADLIFSPSPASEAEVYVMGHGEVLLHVARLYQVTPELIMRINGIRDARRIRARQRLKVLRGPFSARIDLSDFELLILLNDRYVKRYPVGIGKDKSTPTGTFTVTSKLVNPTYYDSVNGKEIAADDPQNPLGERWLGIGDGYGIHGTIEPETIGKAASRGCIRLREPDVEEVYDFLTIGSTVVIRE